MLGFGVSTERRVTVSIENRWSTVGSLFLVIWGAAGAALAQSPERAVVVEPRPASRESTVQEPGSPQVSPQEAEQRRRQTPVFEDRIVVNEVLLDVLVTDKNGNVVTGLGIDDFVVIEDGTLIRPDSVTFYGDPDSLRASGPERSDRYFIFMFHHQKSQSTFQRSAQNRMARDAEKWLEKELLPNDQVAV